MAEVSVKELQFVVTRLPEANFIAMSLKEVHTSLLVEIDDA